MTDATQTETSGAQATSQFSTWGDIDDEFENLTPPDDVDHDDRLTRSTVESWADDLLDQAGDRNFKRLRANATGGRLDRLGELAERDGEIDVPSGGSPFEHEQEDKQADMGPVQTEGPVRQNAKLDDGPEKPDPPVAGGHFTHDHDTADRSSRHNSTDERLNSVSSLAQVMLENLAADDPKHVSEMIAQSPSRLSEQDVRLTLDELHRANLVENQARSNPPKWGPAVEVPDPRASWDSQ